MSNTLIGALLGFLGSITATVLIDYFRRPRLSIEVVGSDPSCGKLRVTERSPQQSGTAGTSKHWVRMEYFHLRLVNKQCWMPWIRQAATNCRGRITFRFASEDNDFSILLRWVTAPEPRTILANVEWDRLNTGQLQVLAEKPQEVEVLPGRGESFDVLVRFPDQGSECYAWSNVSYLSGGYPLPKALKLPGKQCEVEVSILASNATYAKMFQFDGYGFNRGAADATCQRSGSALIVLASQVLRMLHRLGLIDPELGSIELRLLRKWSRSGNRHGLAILRLLRRGREDVKGVHKAVAVAAIWISTAIIVTAVLTVDMSLHWMHAVCITIAVVGSLCGTYMATKNGNKER